MIVFSTLAISGMKYIEGGWAREGGVGVGGWWEAKGGQQYPQGGK